MPSDNTVLTPVDYGAPAQFTTFRHYQERAINQTIRDLIYHKYVGGCFPTGSGKTLIYTLVAHQLLEMGELASQKVVFLTQDKSLQDQHAANFPLVKIIRGKSNYPCDGMKENVFNSKLPKTCEWGERLHCKHAGTDHCTYRQERNAAYASEMVSTNYAYWCRLGLIGSGLNPQEGGQSHDPPGLLVLDEAHLAEPALSNALQISLKQAHLRELKKLTKLDTKKLPRTLEEWMVESKNWRELTSKALEMQENSQNWNLRELHEQLGCIAQTNKDNWIFKHTTQEPSYHHRTPIHEYDVENDSSHHFSWDVIWPGMYAKSVLFHNADMVFAVSGTMREKSLQLLGRKRGTYTFRDWAPVFDRKRSPIYAMPAINYNSKTVTQSNVAQMVKRCDQLMGVRLEAGRNGIIHSVSFDTANDFIRYSKHADRMITHGDYGRIKRHKDHRHLHCQTVRDAVAMFTRIGGVLVSPSIHTGYDFHGDLCRWVIVPKLPFQPPNDPVTVARMANDKQYKNYILVQKLVQSTGRGMRNELDWCEVFIMDSRLDWFYKSTKMFFPVDWLPITAWTNPAMLVPKEDHE